VVPCTNREWGHGRVQARLHACLGFEQLDLKCATLARVFNL
jgi:hypothetical protein